MLKTELKLKKQRRIRTRSKNQKQRKRANDVKCPSIITMEMHSMPTLVT